ncbi:hypothetical protein [Pseudomonas sp. Marseille-P9899]|uniref:hypothetical protein n=1 Tax=Pseudomonas sp. Marseille-P9899 TaxID=2730401 RepID=UPI00158D5D25|nr:hypothetical protein [Pseudomonas sp. Marseille-P9899]
MIQTKERPILFSGPMVRAILDGDKAVTRRAVKMTDLLQVCLEPQEGELKLKAANKLCPLGRPGDRLWVRETWYCDHFEVQRGPYLKPADLDIAEAREDGTLVYAADGLTPYEQEQPVWKPCIHMPRWVSRILLEITDVRVERLQDISEQQALAEGVMSAERDIDPDGNGYSPIELFGGLWVKLNGMDSWSANPWVWVVEFKRVEP